MVTHLDEREIFNTARKLPTTRDQRRYLDQVCGNDSQLRQRIVDLLKGFGDANDFLEPPIAVIESILERAVEISDPVEREAFLDRECQDEIVRQQVEKSLAAPRGITPIRNQAHFDDSILGAVGTSLGPYKIREQLGEGGMGVVYVAEQAEPVHRKVAIKVIKPGMDTKEVIARFEAERQALAYMEHPNIASVLDAGATDSGRPYFVMELVRGIPITDYCDEVKLAPRKRLEIFTTVCDAVQHAHQKGVIHRDLKPSNVMVTQVNARPVVKVIDFGLAKATSGRRLTDNTVYTGFMRLMGTPTYMSPEQAGLSGQDIDTRSDIYSLGVLLYELLTGTTPLDNNEMQHQTVENITRQIRESPALRPSARISTLNDAERLTIAEQRQVDPKSLRRLLHGDLDRVVMKALEKDRDLRYETPKELAADIERFLDDRPVHAVPPNTLYLAGKAMRRHKATVGLVAVIATFLFLATVFSSWHAFRATKAEMHADQERIAADEARQEALASREESKNLRVAAEQTAEDRRRLLYAADMQLADQEWHSSQGSTRKIQELLASWIPTDDEQTDLREFSWRYQWTRLHHSALLTVPNTRAASISEQGKLITADNEGIREWSDSGQQLSLLWEGDARDREISLSSGGRWAMIEEGDNICVVDLTARDKTHLLPGRHGSFSTDGSFVMTTKDDQHKPNDLKVWRTKTGQLHSIEPLLTPELLRMPHRISLFSDGRSMIFWPHRERVGSPTIALINGELAYWKIPDTNRTCRWSPCGKIIANGNEMGVVFLRLTDDPAHAVRLRTFSGGRQIRSLAFSPDSRQIAVGTHEGTVGIWDISAVTQLTHLSIDERMQLVSQSLSDSSSNRVGAIQVVDPPTLKRTLKSHLGSVVDVDFSMDGKRLVTRDGRAAKLWSLSMIGGDFNVNESIDNSFDARPGIYVDDDLKVDGIEDSQHEVVRGEILQGDRILGIREGSTERSDATFQQVQVYFDFFSSVLGPYGSVVSLKIEAAKTEETQIVEVRRLFRHPPKFGGIAFDPNEGNFLVIADNHRGNIFYDLQERLGHRYPAISSSVAISPNGKWLAMDSAKELVLWDLERDEETARLDASMNIASNLRLHDFGTLAFSPDSKYLAMGCGFRRHPLKRRSDLKVWDVEARTEIGDPLWENDRLMCGIAFSPEGGYLAAADSVGTVRIWETSTWTLREDRFLESRENTTDLAFSPDGRTLAQGGEEGVILWDFASRTKQHVLRGQTVVDVNFSRDGNTIATAGPGGNVILWDASTGRRMTTLRHHAARVNGSDFSPNDDRLATVDRDGNLMMWDALAFTQIDRSPEASSALLQLASQRNRSDQFSFAEAILRRVLHMQEQSQTLNRKELAWMRQQLSLSLKGQNKLPAISVQPKSIQVKRGNTARFNVQIENNLACTIQWYFDGKTLTNATNPTLVIPNVSETNLGAYHVEIYPLSVGDFLDPIRSDTAFLGEEGAGPRTDQRNGDPPPSGERLKPPGE